MAGRLIEILCAGDNKIGYGHIRRSLSLASKLNDIGLNVRISGLSEESQAFLPTQRFANFSANVQIFDAPYGIDCNLRRARANNQLTVALDWFGEEVPDINIAIYEHRKIRARRKIYLGFENIIIRDEIVCLRNINLLKDSKSHNVLISIGGADRLGQGPLVAEILVKQGLNVMLVQGPFASEKKLNFEYKFCKNPHDFPKLLNECDWAITNGGGTMFEAMCLGKAAFVLPQTDEEQKLARFAYAKGAILGFGYDNLRVFNAKELRKVGMNGAGLVDGSGLGRVAEIIRGLI